jgi:hypothetical protein
MVGVTSQGPVQRLAFEAYTVVLLRNALRAGAVALGALNCGPGRITSEPELVQRLSFDEAFGDRGAHDIAVSGIGQSGGLEGSHCSLFGDPDGLAERTPPCEREGLEPEAGIGRFFGTKHLKADKLPGRAIYESMRVALKIAQLLDCPSPEGDCVTTLPGGFAAGNFSRAFPSGVAEEPGCQQ